MHISAKISKHPLTQLLAELLALFVITLVVVGALTLLTRNIQLGLTLRFFCIIIILIAIVSTWQGVARFIEGDHNSLYTKNGAVLDLIYGISSGFALAVGIAFFSYCVGTLKIMGINGSGDLWPIATLAIAPAVLEELVFRGIILRHTEAMLGTWAALAISSILFGAAHLANPDVSLLDAVAITVEFGVLLGAVYLFTRRLWLATGLHAAWNFTIGWMFSLPISGYGSHGLLISQLVGPDILTGGKFGLEGSIITLFAGTASGVITLYLFIKRRVTI